MSLIPIDAIKDLLTGSIWDKFKEMIEPYALVNAIILIVLNLALVYPAIGNQVDNPFLTALADAKDVWKLTIGTIILFVISYLINHLSTFSLDFASGEVFRKSPVFGRLLKERQGDQFDDLKNEKISVKADDDSLKRDLAAFRLAYEFPVEKTELGLTKLGNLLLSPPSYVAHQYGTSMQLIWPFIQEKVEDDDKTLKSIQGNWNSLLFFASLYGLLILVVVELIVVATFGGKNLNFWQIAILLLFTGISYLAATEKARQWGRGMRHIFDAHAKELFTDLGMEALKDLNPADSEYKSRGEEVMGWLAYGTILGKMYPPKTSWYKADPTPTPETWPKLKHPEFLSVESIPRFTKKELFSRKDGDTYICIEQSVEYLFAVTNTSTGENPLPGKETYLLVQDEGVTPPNTVTGYLSKINTTAEPLAFDKVEVKGRRQDGKPAGLLFPLGDLPPGTSRILTYSFESHLAKVTADFGVNRVELDKDKDGPVIDIYPDNITADVNVNLTIEIVDDANTTLSSIANISPPQRAYPPEGTMAKENRSGVWSFTLRTDVEKIRVRLIRDAKGG